MNNTTPNPEKKLTVLFLCTGNSCRSQMAEGWARHLKGEQIEAYSAGIDPHALNPWAVQVMAEAGIDISRQRSQHINEFEDVEFDYVVSVCDRARQSCPALPSGKHRLHVAFDDPPRQAITAVTDEQTLAPYRRVRDEIRKFIEEMPDNLATFSSTTPGG